MCQVQEPHRSECAAYEDHVGLRTTRGFRGVIRGRGNAQQPGIAWRSTAEVGPVDRYAVLIGAKAREREGGCAIRACRRDEAGNSGEGKGWITARVTSEIRGQEGRAVKHGPRFTGSRRHSRHISRGFGPSRDNLDSRQ